MSRLTNALRNGNFYDHIINSTTPTKGTEFVCTYSLNNSQQATAEHQAIGTNYGNLASALVPYLTTAEVIDIVSDSANDTSAGAGARTVSFVGAQIASGAISYNAETVTMNGITDVPTASTYATTLHMRVATLGSTMNQGIITAIPDTSTTKTQGQMDASAGITRLPVFATSSDYEAEVFLFMPQSSVADAKYRLTQYDAATGFQTITDTINGVGIGSNPPMGHHFIGANNIFFFSAEQSSGGAADMSAVIGIYFTRIT